MIEFALFSALGFLIAALLGLIVAPAIYRRVVHLTERRMRKTVPLNAAEIKASSDIERAKFAAENSKINVQLRQERDQHSATIASKSRLSQTIADMRGKNDQLQRSLQDLTAESGQLRSSLRREELKLAEATKSLSEAKRENTQKHEQLQRLIDKANRLETELDSQKIDLASKDTESENLRAIVDKLRNEQLRLANNQLQLENKVRKLRSDLELERARSQDLEQRLKTSQTKVDNQNERLARRALEMKQLREKMSLVRSEASQLRKTLRASETDRKSLQRELNKVEKQLSKLTGEPAKKHELADIAIPAKTKFNNLAEEQEPPQPEIKESLGNKKAQNSTKKSKDTIKTRKLKPAKRLSEADIAKRIEHLRARHNALVAELKRADPKQSDSQYRQELAEIAAMMVEVTAAREGANSKIHKLLPNGQKTGDTDLQERALAHRIQMMMDGDYRAQMDD